MSGGMIEEDTATGMREDDDREKTTSDRFVPSRLLQQRHDDKLF